MDEYLKRRAYNLKSRINCITDKLDSGMCEDKSDYSFLTDSRERLTERLKEIECLQLMSQAHVYQN